MRQTKTAQEPRESRARIIAHVCDPRADEIARILFLFTELIAAHGDCVNLYGFTQLPLGEIEHEPQGGIPVVEMAGAEAERRDDERQPRLAQVARATDESLRGPRAFVAGPLVEYRDAKKKTRVISRRAAAVADRPA